MTISDHPPALDDGPTTDDLAGPSDVHDEAAVDAEALAQRQRLGAWMEVGATSLPALLVALGSALVGAVTMLIRRRRRR